MLAGQQLAPAQIAAFAWPGKKWLEKLRRSALVKGNQEKKEKKEKKGKKEKKEKKENHEL